MVRGEVIDLPGAGAWTVNAAWRADALRESADVDVVAFLLDTDERVGFSRPHPDGRAEPRPVSGTG
jgi:hypothetical protein